MAKYYTPPPVTPRQKQADEAGEWSFLMPFGKALIRTDEACELIGRSPQYVRELIEAGRLESHQDTVRGTRLTNLITRRSVELYLIETSNYDPSFLVLRLESVLKKLNRAALERLIATATRLLHQIRS